MAVPRGVFGGVGAVDGGRFDGFQTMVADEDGREGFVFCCGEGLAFDVVVMNFVIDAVAVEMVNGELPFVERVVFHLA